MSKFLRLIFIFLTALLFFTSAPAQAKDRVEVEPFIPTDQLKNECQELELGKIIFFYEPNYPKPEQNARVGGNVNVNIKVDVTGNTLQVLSVTGSTEFREIASAAARKLKFTPTVCDGKSIPVQAVITYKFIPDLGNESYFTPTSVREFADVHENSPFYFPISILTDDYQICFGYSDKNYRENAPLTRGEFAQFLRLTLDLLFKRATVANKAPMKMGLMRPFNPQNLTALSSIKDLEKNQPYYKSVGVLLQNYNIALVGDDLSFAGTSQMTQNEVIDLWASIFTKEAVPVNFVKTDGSGRPLSRGEFALFLQESMQVLTYKVLP
ncbi:MAG: TonB family protein [Pyrinomonadaceae bacterium]